MEKNPWQGRRCAGPKSQSIFSMPWGEGGSGGSYRQGWDGRNNIKQYEKAPTPLCLFKERKIGSHDNWTPLLHFRGGRGFESLFEALVILEKPPLLSAASAGDQVWAEGPCGWRKED